VTTRNLEYFFKPKSIALIGASRDPQSVGGVVAKNLRHDGFSGPIMLVNRHGEQDPARNLFHEIKDLPEAPELAVIAVPATQVPAIIGELGRRGTHAVVVLSAGFEEVSDARGAELQQAMLEAAQPYLMRIIGPNCLGVMMPKAGFNATFAHLMPKAGKLAFIAQSGAIITAVADWAAGRDIGFSCMLSLGASSDVDFGDLLDYLADDWNTKAILLYIESVKQARKFMSAARLASRLKPVIVVKGGRYTQSAHAVASHTGALAGVDAVYAAAFQRAGMVQVDSLGELFDAVETLAHASYRYGDRLAILSNGGGIGVLATDELTRVGGVLAELSQETQTKLKAVLPAMCATGNPVDILGDAPPERYRDAFQILMQAKEVDTIAVFNCPIGVASSSAAAQVIIEASADRRKGILTNWLGQETAQYARQQLTRHDIPTYETPGQLIHAYMHLIQYRRGQQALLETPPSLPEIFTPDVAQARAVIHKALEEGREWLTQQESMTLLSAYRIPCVPTREAATPEEVAQICAQWQQPVAVKIISPDIVHKRVMGGVALNLETPEAARDASSAMIERLHQTLPQARLHGFTVQPMARRGEVYELILGMVDDQVFGPVMLFGQGGNAVEALNDTAFALPPLNLKLACELIGRTRISRLLHGVGGMPAVPVNEVALALIKLSQLAIDFGEIVEIEINPLLANEQGLLALDVRTHLRPTHEIPEKRFAIRPYPKELEETFTLPDGQQLVLRPIQPEDEPALIHLFDSLTEEERYMRFFSPMPKVPHQMAARLSQIDYDREMALVLAEPKPAGEAKLMAGARIAGDPNNERCEFAIAVDHAYTGKGIGKALLQKIVDYARSRGYREVYGDILNQNQPMLAVCRRLGFHAMPGPEAGIVRMSLSLNP